MRRQFRLNALLIGGILILTGCGMTKEKVDQERITELEKEVAENGKAVEIEEEDKDKSRSEIQQVENTKYQSIVWIGEAGKKNTVQGF